MRLETRVERDVGFELRRATPADREAVLEMYLSFEPKGANLGLPPREAPGSWLDRLSAYPNFLLEASGRIVGHAVLCTDGDSAEVAVFVHQDFRGRGLGKRLLREVVEEAKRRGLGRVWGVTESNNIPMLRLAHSLGFVPGESLDEFYLDLRPPTPTESLNESVT